MTFGAARSILKTSIISHLFIVHPIHTHTHSITTMSYADVAKNNAPAPTSADPAFLDGAYNQPPTDGHGASDIPSTALPDVDSHKINVVPAGTDLNALHTQSEQTSHETEQRVSELEQNAREEAERVKEKAKNLKEDAKHGLHKAEKKVSKAANDASSQAKKSWAQFSSDPKAWASSLGALNIVVLGGLGVYAYTQRDAIRAWDRRVLVAVVGGVGAVLGLQAYAGTEKAREQTGRK
ncbi:unnamed protein product [Tilletia laevis]|uniref:Mitochondrial outer membrane protein OM14 C-terminal domain-containing protein n=2 Tax=Tilletia TaxID=13289 RepID=A0A9N8LK77_9BASI|nr:hypothetical protein CF336_g5723 [Tilletia laevis]CAD6919414.1 unnamed protein product [Tilletia laevis]